MRLNLELIDELRRDPNDMKDATPVIVTLCGSTKFIEYFKEYNLQLTLAYVIVLSVGAFGHSDSSLKLTEETKKNLDKLHKRKIDVSDAIVVLNVGGYIGESTRSEIDYARKNGKRIYYIEEVNQ